MSDSHGTGPNINTSQTGLSPGSGGNVNTSPPQASAQASFANVQHTLATQSIERQVYDFDQYVIGVWGNTNIGGLAGVAAGQVPTPGFATELGYGHFERNAANANAFRRKAIDLGFNKFAYPNAMAREAAIDANLRGTGLTESAVGGQSQWKQLIENIERMTGSRQSYGDKLGVAIVTADFEENSAASKALVGRPVAIEFSYGKSQLTTNLIDAEGMTLDSIGRRTKAVEFVTPGGTRSSMPAAALDVLYDVDIFGPQLGSFLTGGIGMDASNPTVFRLQDRFGFNLTDESGVVSKALFKKSYKQMDRLSRQLERARKRGVQMAPGSITPNLPGSMMFEAQYNPNQIKTWKTGEMIESLDIGQNSMYAQMRGTSVDVPSSYGIEAGRVSAYRPSFIYDPSGHRYGRSQSTSVTNIGPSALRYYNPINIPVMDPQKKKQLYLQGGVHFKQESLNKYGSSIGFGGITRASMSNTQLAQETLQNTNALRIPMYHATQTELHQALRLVNPKLAAYYVSEDTGIASSQLMRDLIGTKTSSHKILANQHFKILNIPELAIGQAAKGLAAAGSVVVDGVSYSGQEAVQFYSEMMYKSFVPGSSLMSSITGVAEMHYPGSGSQLGTDIQRLVTQRVQEIASKGTRINPRGGRLSKHAVLLGGIGGYGGNEQVLEPVYINRGNTFQFTDITMSGGGRDAFMTVHGVEDMRMTNLAKLLGTFKMTISGRKMRQSYLQETAAIIDMAREVGVSPDQLSNQQIATAKKNARVDQKYSMLRILSPEGKAGGGVEKGILDVTADDIKTTGKNRFLQFGKATRVHDEALGLVEMVGRIGASGFSKSELASMGGMFGKMGLSLGVGKAGALSIESSMGALSSFERQIMALDPTYMQESFAVRMEKAAAYIEAMLSKQGNTPQGNALRDAVNDIFRTGNLGSVGPGDLFNAAGTPIQSRSALMNTISSMLIEGKSLQAYEGAKDLMQLLHKKGYSGFGVGLFTAVDDIITLDKNVKTSSLGVKEINVALGRSVSQVQKQLVASKNASAIHRATMNMAIDMARPDLKANAITGAELLEALKFQNMNQEQRTALSDVMRRMIGDPAGKMSQDELVQAAMDKYQVLSPDKVNRSKVASFMDEILMYGGVEERGEILKHFFGGKSRLSLNMEGGDVFANGPFEATFGKSKERKEKLARSLREKFGIRSGKHGEIGLETIPLMPETEYGVRREMLKLGQGGMAGHTPNEVQQRLRSIALATVGQQKTLGVLRDLDNSQSAVAKSFGYLFNMGLSTTSKSKDFVKLMGTETAIVAGRSSLTSLPDGRQSEAILRGLYNSPTALTTNAEFEQAMRLELELSRSRLSPTEFKDMRTQMEARIQSFKTGGIDLGIGMRHPIQSSQRVNTLQWASADYWEASDVGGRRIMFLKDAREAAIDKTRPWANLEEHEKQILRNNALVDLVNSKMQQDQDGDQMYLRTILDKATFDDQLNKHRAESSALNIAHEMFQDKKTYQHLTVEQMIANVRDKMDPSLPMMDREISAADIIYKYGTGSTFRKEMGAAGGVTAAQMASPGRLVALEGMSNKVGSAVDAASMVTLFAQNNAGKIMKGTNMAKRGMSEVGFMQLIDTFNDQFVESFAGAKNFHNIEKLNELFAEMESAFARGDLRGTTNKYFEGLELMFQNVDKMGGSGPSKQIAVELLDKIKQIKVSASGVLNEYYSNTDPRFTNANATAQALLGGAVPEGSVQHVRTLIAASEIGEGEPNKIKSALRTEVWESYTQQGHEQLIENRSAAVASHAAGSAGSGSVPTGGVSAAGNTVNPTGAGVVADAISESMPGGTVVTHHMGSNFESKVIDILSRNQDAMAKKIMTGVGIGIAAFAAVSAVSAIVNRFGGDDLDQDVARNTATSRRESEMVAQNAPMQQKTVNVSQSSNLYNYSTSLNTKYDHVVRQGVKTIDIMSNTPSGHTIIENQATRADIDNATGNNYNKDSF